MICNSPCVGFVFLPMWDLYFSFPIGFLYLGIIWARARLLPPCLFLARQIRLIGGATFYKAPKTPHKPFIMYLQHPILEILNTNTKIDTNTDIDVRKIQIRLIGGANFYKAP